MPESRTYIFGPKPKWIDEETRPCEHEGCTGKGIHRAPRSPNDLRSYYWFCLDHVREYNKSWNFYAGLNEAEIEAQIRDDTVWQRPTWPMGAGDWRAFRDAGETLQTFYRRFNRRPGGRGGGEPYQPQTATPEDKALATLDLKAPASFESVKARYKELAKRLHPDINGGDKDAEEKLKGINEAYSMLKNRVLP